MWGRVAPVSDCSFFERLLTFGENKQCLKTKIMEPKTEGLAAPNKLPIAVTGDLVFEAGAKPPAVDLIPPPQLIRIENDPFGLNGTVEFTAGEQKLFEEKSRVIKTFFGNYVPVQEKKLSADEVVILEKSAQHLVAIRIKGQNNDALRHQVVFLYFSSKLTLQHGEKMKFFADLSNALDDFLEFELRDLNRDILLIRRWLGVEDWTRRTGRQPSDDDLKSIKPVSLKALKLDPYFKEILTSEKLSSALNDSNFKKKYGSKITDQSAFDLLLKCVAQLTKITEGLDLEALKVLKTKTQIVGLVEKLATETFNGQDILKTMPVKSKHREHAVGSGETPSNK